MNHSTMHNASNNATTLVIQFESYALQINIQKLNMQTTATVPNKEKNIFVNTFI